MFDERNAPLYSIYSDNEEMRELITWFVSELSDRGDELEEALQARDTRTLLSMAHQLKGAGGSYGFDAITEAAGGLEKCLKRGAGGAEVAAATTGLVDLCRRAAAPEPEGQV